MESTTRISFLELRVTPVWKFGVVILLFVGEKEIYDFFELAISAEYFDGCKCSGASKNGTPETAMKPVGPGEEHERGGERKGKGEE
jgi:hypothetical protein